MYEESSSDEVSASNEVNTSRESTKVKFKINIEKAFQGNGKVSQKENKENKNSTKDKKSSNVNQNLNQGTDKVSPGGSRQVTQLQKVKILQFIKGRNLNKVILTFFIPIIFPSSNETETPPGTGGQTDRGTNFTGFGFEHCCCQKFVIFYYSENFQDCGIPTN